MATVAGILLTGTHAARPAAGSVSAGTLYSCTDHSLIYQTDGSSWSTWATLGTSGAVATDTIWDAKGDLAAGTGANTASKLAIGTNGYVLTADSGEATGLKWAAASGGSGTVFDGKSMVWTPPTSAATEDDEFNDTTGMSGPVNGLDAKWTKHNLGTASWIKLDDAVAPGAVQFQIPSGQSSDQSIYQTVPAGDFTIWCRFHVQVRGREMWGPFIVSSSGAGIAAEIDFSTGNDNGGLRELSSWAQTGNITSWSISSGDTTTTRYSVNHYTVFLRKSGSDYYGGWSTSDRARPGGIIEITRTPTAFTPAYIGFGRVYDGGISVPNYVTLDFFRKI